jgi:hypothetical protein
MPNDDRLFKFEPVKLKPGAVRPLSGRPRKLGGERPDVIPVVTNVVVSEELPPEATK